MSPDTQLAYQTDALPDYAPLQIRDFRNEDTAAWDAFALNAPGGSFFHRAGWKRVIETTLKHKAYYRCAWRNGHIVGLLPLIHIKSRLFGDSLVATGFTTGGGILAEDAETAAALALSAEQLGMELGVGFIELRQETPSTLGAEWIAKPELYFGFSRELQPDDDKNLKAVPRKKRADLRKAIDNKKLSIDANADPAVFFAIYAESLRNLGTPVLTPRFYAALKQEFGDDIELSSISGPEGPVAALMTFFFKDRALPYYGGATHAARPLHAFDLMYWSLMQRAWKRGAMRFDFGRSKRGTGSFDYKTYWGFTPEALNYRYRLLGLGELPEINPLNPKYRMKIAAWQKLPLFAANTIGPFIARQIG